MDSSVYMKNVLIDISCCVELLIENKKEIAESLLMKIQNKIDKDSKRKKAKTNMKKQTNKTEIIDKIKKYLK